MLWRPKKYKAFFGFPPKIPLNYFIVIKSSRTLRYFGSGWSIPILDKTITAVLKNSYFSKHFSQIRDPFGFWHVHLVFDGTFSLNIFANTWSKKIQPLLKTKKWSFSFCAQYFSYKLDKMLAICEGLYHWPGSILYKSLAALEIFWIEKGDFLSTSLKRFRSYCLSGGIPVWICLCSLMIWANNICPTLIIHPHPVSLT